MKKKNYIGYYNIVKNESKREATIYIYGVIGGFDWDTWTFINTADSFLKEFSEVEKEADTIHVRINSPGGNVHDGLAIYNALYNSEKEIITYNDGICYSMAALLMLAGKKSVSFDNCLFMTHNVISAVWGNADEMRTEADVLDKYDAALGTAIENKLGISSEEVGKRFLNYKDNYFTAREAKNEGFYDEIIKKDSNKIPENLKDLSPKNLIEHYAKMNWDQEEKKSPPKNTTMKTFPLVLAALGLNALASNENGSYLNEEQFEMLENELARLAKEVEDGATALTNAATETKSAKDKAAGHVTTLEAIAENIGADKGATLEETVTNVENRIKEINGKAGAKHTTAADENKDDKSESFDYIDYNSPIYKEFQN